MVDNELVNELKRLDVCLHDALFWPNAGVNMPAGASLTVRSCLCGQPDCIGSYSTVDGHMRFKKGD